MGTSGNKISQAPEALSRPSLLSTGAPSADHNILDAMSGRSEHAPAGVRPGRHGWWLLLPLLLAAAVWGISTQRPEPAAARPVATAPAQPASPLAPVPAPGAATAPASPASTSTTQAVATAAAPAPARSPDPFQSLAATAMTPAHSPQTNPVAELQASLGGPAAVPAPPAPRPRAEQASKAATAAKKSAPPKTQAVPPSPGKPTTTAARKTPAPQPKSNAQASATAPKQTKPAATASAQAGGRDPDVELLSAIMKHLGDDKKPTTAAAPARSPQTIAELVKSCRTRDAIEALVCQRRICEGSWGKAQACPMDQAPKAARTASPT